MKLKHIADTLLDEASPPAQLQAALNAFVQLCSAVGGVIPDRSFDAWAGDSLLQDGVAISPEAAASLRARHSAQCCFYSRSLRRHKSRQKALCQWPD